jgi:phosphatidate cytidylyltransferase
MAKDKEDKKVQEPEKTKGEGVNQGITGKEHEGQNRMSSFKVRTITTLMMFAALIFVLWSGQAYTAGVVIILMVMWFKELKELKRRREQEHNIPFFNVINWYFFFCTLAFLLPNFIPSQTRIGITDPTLQWIAEYRVFISFCSFVAGVLIFTLSLENGSYKYQFKMFGWTIMVLLFTTTQTCGMIYNLYKGMYWFLFPALCVIANDIFAYIFGFFYGKTPLIKLSPKKTWEGFIGGLVCTFIWAFVGSYFLSTIPALVCPQTNISLQPFQFPHCELSPLYIVKPYNLPVSVFGYDTLWVSPVQQHSMIIALFASMIAPFGGFFASGFKRAFKIKDFGAWIPGHGGIMDRFDCHIVMCMFTFVYLHQIVFKLNPSLENILVHISRLNQDQQMSLYEELSHTLFPQ